MLKESLKEHQNKIWQFCYCFFFFFNKVDFILGLFHDMLGKNTGVGCHFLLQGIFLTQGSNLGFSHCRQIFYHLSHQGIPMI